MFVPAYFTVLCQSISPDGTLLAVGEENSGQVDVFRTEILASRDGVNGGAVKPHRRIRLPDGSPVLSMETTKNHLIVGSVGRLYVYLWSDILSSSTSVDPKGTIKLEAKPTLGCETDANCLQFDGEDSTAGTLLVGAGDSTIHVIDLETGMLTRKLEKHQDFIHGLSLCASSKNFVSGGEDGIVCLWDRRKQQANVHELNPSSHTSLARPKLGKWIGAVSLSSDWLICGGGPRASTWHLRTLSPYDPLPPHADDIGIHVLELVDDRVVIGGETKTLYQTSMTGDILSEITVSSCCIYSVVATDKPVKMLSAAGASSNIDICSPCYSYKDRTVECFRP